MATVAFSVISPADAEVEAERLLQAHTLAELSAIQARVREQIAEQAQQLRDLVGAKHTTLLECADAIDSMKAAAEEGAEHVSSASALCARVEQMGGTAIERTAASTGHADGEATRARNPESAAVRRLAALAAAAFVDGALENAWAALEEGEPLRSAWVLITANALALEPELSETLRAQADLASFGVAELVTSVGSRTASFRAELLGVAERLARAPAQRARVRAHALGALVLLDGWSDADCLQLMLAAADDNDECGSERARESIGEGPRAASVDGGAVGGARSVATRLARRARALRDAIAHSYVLLSAGALSDGTPTMPSEQPATELERTLALFSVAPASPPLARARAPRTAAGTRAPGGGGAISDSAHGVRDVDGGGGDISDDDDDDNVADDMTNELPHTLGCAPLPAAIPLVPTCAELRGLQAACRTPPVLAVRRARSLSTPELARAVSEWWTPACVRAREYGRGELARVRSAEELAAIASALWRACEPRGVRDAQAWAAGCAALAPEAQHMWAELWRPLVADRAAQLATDALTRIGVASELNDALRALRAGPRDARDTATAVAVAAGADGGGVAAAAARAVCASLGAQVHAALTPFAPILGGEPLLLAPSTTACAQRGTASASEAPAGHVRRRLAQSGADVHAACVHVEASIPELRAVLIRGCEEVIARFGADVERATAELTRAVVGAASAAPTDSVGAGTDGAAAARARALGAECGLCLGTIAEAVLADGVGVRQLLRAACAQPAARVSAGGDSAAEARWDALARAVSGAAEQARALWVSHAAEELQARLCAGADCAYARAPVGERAGDGSGVGDGYALGFRSARDFAATFSPVSLGAVPPDARDADGAGALAEDVFKLPLRASPSLSVALLDAAAECAAVSARGHPLPHATVCALRDSVYGAVLRAIDAAEADDEALPHAAAFGVATLTAADERAAGEAAEAIATQRLFDLEFLLDLLGPPSQPGLAAAVRATLNSLSAHLDPVDWAMSAPLLTAAAREHSARTSLLLGGALAHAGSAQPAQEAHTQAVRAAMQAAQSAWPVAPPCARFTLLPVTLPRLDEPDADPAGSAAARARGARAQQRERDSAGGLARRSIGDVAPRGGAPEGIMPQGPAAKASRPWAAWFGPADQPA
ncbi:hypothetical protein KFE25_001146 [Diacronema lutheri]|uniref:Conserved oligomeric Golgi complex subunit 1 n=1 Tax=Diacronema lutheri TaxID=2081491 RepID=A0A8J6C4A6_DIALT|nr:hypothetical protein KFE25_001146 [Diacronema lutheri]